MEARGSYGNGGYDKQETWTSNFLNTEGLSGCNVTSSQSISEGEEGIFTVGCKAAQVVLAESYMHRGPLVGDR